MATSTPLYHILRKIEAQPDWVNGDIGNYPEPVLEYIEKNGMVQGPLQQSDLLKPVIMDAVKFGLTYCFYKYRHKISNFNHKDPYEDYKYKKTENPKKVIIIGAGLAGLVAAYELAQVGHEVQILEMQTRLGGRVKTFGEKDGFAKHLYVDGKYDLLLLHAII